MKRLIGLVVWVALSNMSVRQLLTNIAEDSRIMQRG
jgi:hypothetical protein